MPYLLSIKLLTMHFLWITFQNSCRNLSIFSTFVLTDQMKNWYKTKNSIRKQQRLETNVSSFAWPTTEAKYHIFANTTKYCSWSLVLGKTNRTRAVVSLYFVDVAVVFNGAWHGIAELDRSGSWTHKTGVWSHTAGYAAFVNHYRNAGQLVYLLPLSKICHCCCCVSLLISVGFFNVSTSKCF